MKKSKKIGALIKNGHEMLKIQANKSFEIWKNKQSIDPLIYFPEYDKTDLTSNNNNG